MMSLQAEALSKGFGPPPSSMSNGNGAPLAALHGLQPWAPSAPPEINTAGCWTFQYCVWIFSVFTFDGNEADIWYLSWYMQSYKLIKCSRSVINFNSQLIKQITINKQLSNNEAQHFQWRNKVLSSFNRWFFRSQKVWNASGKLISVNIKEKINFSLKLHSKS